MAVVLDLADIQGNILIAYGKQGFQKADLSRCMSMTRLARGSSSTPAARDHDRAAVAISSHADSSG
jgi:hypothetical protein